MKRGSNMIEKYEFFALKTIFKTKAIDRENVKGSKEKEMMSGL